MKLYYNVYLRSKEIDEVASVGEPAETDSQIIFTLEGGDEKVYDKNLVVRYLVKTFEPFSL